MPAVFGKQVLDFHFGLNPDLPVPAGVEVLFPYQNKMTRSVMEQFFMKYFNDREPRTFLFGINPGRFGAGVTGVPFTDPLRLKEVLKIENDFHPKPELSSVFIFQILEAFGGVEAFYKHFYITSLSPLGFVKDGKNYNYYDDRALEKSVTPFIVQSIRRQMDFGANREAAICIGEGQNFRFFEKINLENCFFKKIIPLPHPRWVMQYRRKKADEFVEKYLAVLRQIKNPRTG